MINTQGMQDKTYAESLNRRARQLLASGCAEAEKIFRAVYARLDA